MIANSNGQSRSFYAWERLMFLYFMRILAGDFSSSDFMAYASHNFKYR